MIASGRRPQRATYTLAYVYRLDSRGRPIKPYAAKWGALEGALELLTRIQYSLGAGEFRVIIRSGRRMLYSGIVRVGSPPRRLPSKWTGVSTC